MTRPAVFSACFHKPEDFEALEAMTGMKVVIGREGIKLVDRIDEYQPDAYQADFAPAKFAGERT